MNAWVRSLGSLRAAVVAIVVALIPELHDVAPFSWFIGAGPGAALYAWLAGREPAAAMPVQKALP